MADPAPFDQSGGKGLAVELKDTNKSKAEREIERAVKRFKKWLDASICLYPKIVSCL